MEFRYVFVSLAVGDGTVLRLENVQDAGRRRKRNVICGFFAHSARLCLDSSIPDSV